MYLTPNSGFYDARQGSLFAAEDIFGPCSFEYQQVANAWHAVGVGEPVTMMDFSVIDISTFDLFDVEDSGFVTVSIKHLGCESTGPITLDVNMIKSNPPKSHTEQLELPEGMGPGEVIEYTFTEPFDFRRTRDHSLTARVENAEDLNPGNNSSKEFVVNKIRQTSEQKFAFHLKVAPKP